MAGSLETYLGAAMSKVMPEQPVQSSAYALASLLPDIADKLDREDTKELITLGAFLWRKSQSLGENALDVRFITDQGVLKFPEGGAAMDWEDEDEEVDFLSTNRGPWQPIESVPKDRRVDLWVDIFEFAGEVVEDCWWNDEASIPDWYSLDNNGQPELAIPIHGYASHWKELGAPGVRPSKTVARAMVCGAILMAGTGRHGLGP